MRFEKTEAVSGSGSAFCVGELDQGGDSMHFKDAARSFGRVGVLLPLILIFLTAADSAFACPGHTSKVSFRTKSINTRTASYMPATVITYRAPASYKRCGANVYDTRGARYVAVRSNAYHNGSSAKYVAVRNDSGYNKVRRARYTALQDVDLDSVRYVALHNRAADRTRYIAVRSGYRRGNGIVGYLDVDGPRHVAVQRVVPRTRYVAVRDIDDYDGPRYVAVRRVAPRAKYVAVRNIDSGCTRAVALRSCLDDVETTSVGRVVLRNDVGYSTRTKHVVLEDEDDDDAYAIRHEIDDDDDEYIAVADHTPRHVEYTHAAYSNGNGATYIAANDFDNTCVRNVAVRTCRPDAVSTRTLAYEVSDDDLDDQVFVHDDDAIYVAATDMEDACLPRRVVGTSTRFVVTNAVESVPAVYVAEDASPLGSQAAYVETRTDNTAVPWPRYVALNEDRVFDDLDPTWVAEVEDTCLQSGTHCNLAEKVAAGTVNFVPVNDVENLDTETVGYAPVEAIDAEEVSYVPADHTAVETVSYTPAANMDTRTLSYLPVDDVDEADVSFVSADNMHGRTVSYLPVESDDVDTVYVDADECPMLISSSEPVYVDDASTVHVEEVDDDLVAGLQSTQGIAGGFGYRDGFEDGQDAALEGDVFHPENSGDYAKATEGYEDEFGHKDVYKDSYRNSYLAGYRAGFSST